mmetsp:Transcript_37414/g.57315  ORF Transcript_37414/g.57315 Transcript_37414/m.57315 type:complete len:165 (-) Transcript_37414:1449-1943(-)
MTKVRKYRAMVRMMKIEKVLSYSKQSSKSRSMAAGSENMREGLERQTELESSLRVLPAAEDEDSSAEEVVESVEELLLSAEVSLEIGSSVEEVLSDSDVEVDSLVEAASGLESTTEGVVAEEEVEPSLEVVSDPAGGDSGAAELASTADEESAEGASEFTSGAD